MHLPWPEKTVSNTIVMVLEAHVPLATINAGLRPFGNMRSKCKHSNGLSVETPEQRVRASSPRRHAARL
jgi:hypothetical protein